LQTLTYGDSGTASEETTALAAQAFLRAGEHGESVTQALTYLVRSRGASGAWSTTQATILALQALLAASDGMVGKGTGTIRVQLDGKEAATIELTEQNKDVMQQLDLSSLLIDQSLGGDRDRERGGGSDTNHHRLTCSLQGDIKPVYQVVTRSYVPWSHVPSSRPARIASSSSALPAAKPVEISVDYDRTTLRQNDVLEAQVKIRSHAKRSLPMLIVDSG
jgi:hypothetical protein